MDRLPLVRLANRFSGRSDVATHAHDFIEFILVTRGVLSIFSDDLGLKGQVGDFFVIPSRMPHLQVEEDIVETTYIGFTWDNEPFDTQFRKVNLKNEFFISKWMEDIVHMHIRPDKGDLHSMAQSCLLMTIIRKLQNYEHECNFIRSIHPKIQDALEIIDHNLTKPISVAQVAEAVDISESHLSALFKQYTGYSPIRYQQIMRMKLACTHLQNPYLKISQVAHYCGYEDVNFFI